MITFSLKAQKKPDGKYIIREYFVFHLDSKPPVHMEGYVDDGIRKEHAKEYAEFARWVSDNKDIEYPKAKIACDPFYKEKE